LPAGGFETQFSFAQALTESAKLAGNCMLVISLPASDTSGSPHAQSEDVEVGGIRGREALDRLRNVVGRVESSWRPATAEEGFEIVRRRLFEPLSGPDAFKQRDVTARAFADLYHAQSAEFPPECRGGDYEKRLQAAFPIHPEIFDRLYTDWSTLVKFQRTRGVLRLMAAVIHSLWEKGDRNPLILPSTVPIDDPRVQSELTRYPGSPPPRLTFIRMVRASGTRPSRPSPSSRRIAPNSSSATRFPTVSLRNWTSGCARICARRGTFRASIRCHVQMPTCRMIS